ncbi:MAG: thermonuclease family protein [Clostridiales bacterium]|nr:thermonuclease family protein [Clostridiales bacterium]
MKKIIIIVIVCILLAGYYLLVDNKSDIDNPPDSTQIDQTVQDNTAPSLAQKDFSDMGFFDDGYEIVEYIRTSDGDTASFIVDRLNVKVRFLAIDTPETAKENAEAERWAEEAKEYTREILENADLIILEKDRKDDSYDKYDRLLAWVWVDGELLNYKLVEMSLATTRYLRDYHNHYSALLDIEKEAKKTELGIWSE